jgi:hypothetical protein
METEQNLERVLSDNQIEDDVADNLRASFMLLDALAFAKRLRVIPVPDSVKSALLALKVQTPTQPKNDALLVVLEASMIGFWNRLAGDAARGAR